MDQEFDRASVQMGVDQIVQQIAVLQPFVGLRVLARTNQGEQHIGKVVGCLQGLALLCNHTVSLYRATSLLRAQIVHCF